MKAESIDAYKALKISITHGGLVVLSLFGRNAVQLKIPHYGKC
ncbi:hypothetical protein MGMO_18c00350 [Methyloglobulus morosus KoM1]|uniref:Uncharacterized protein n=1 Tax=Methyloglobulus morosus KoM1 TaxID=1116472 RepID=V5C4Z5_9GAMM|nr:hypothetical protein [Methyloglobulus morosus]ESS73527.1 hypothetical protein MGMO_18c00350 [Methyloglobulus morosus KoM1]